jgi:hypothetical protein
MVAKILLTGTFGLPARAVTESLAVLGRKGGGKTNTGGVLFEQMFGIGAQCVALDPVGNWFGLRLSASGKRKGLDIPVFGGAHADMSITPTSGKLIAQIVVERRVSCVIDLMFFKPEQRRLFAADFAEELFELKKTNRSPLHLFVDEARKFIPQLKKSKLDQRMSDSFDDIVRLGRNYGLGVSLLDQRPQSVDKEVLSQTEILIVHQLTETHARKAIEDWVRSKTTKGAEELDQLDQLKMGEAFIWSPGLLGAFARIQVEKKTTYDASRTPELGDAASSVTPRPLDAGDLSKLKEAMSAVEAEAAASDPTKLRQEVQRLRAQVVALEARPPATTATVVKEKIVEVQVIDPDTVKRIEWLVKQVSAGLTPIGERLSEMGQHVSLISKMASSTATSSPTTSPSLQPRRLPAPAPRPPSIDDVVKPRGTAHRPGSGPPQGVAGELKGPELRILGALAWLASIGVHEADATTVAFLAKYRVGGAFNNPKGKLRSMGLIKYPSGGTLRLTAAGTAAAPEAEVPLTTEALHEHVMARLKGPEQRLLAPLLAAYPNSMTAAELAKASGYEIGGAFNNPKGRLRSLGLAEYPTSGTVRATDRLFLKR